MVIMLPNMENDLAKNLNKLYYHQINKIIIMIELEKEQKEPNQYELLKLLDQREPSVKISEKSQKACQEYLEFFSDLDKESITKDALIQKLRHAKIRYEGWKEASQYSIRIVKSVCDNQIVTLEVSIGPFVLLVNLCNCSTKNYTHYLQGKTSAFATIYDYNIDQSKAIIKCTTFKPKDFLDTLIIVVKEYSFLKIAAVLEVGPQIMPIFGFDLLVFEDCIEFSMQKCEPLLGIDENIVKILKEKLQILHKLNILHIDIKPQNFCHSPLLNQPIFIDFGLSQVIKQQPGESTDTAFMGSLNYCSPQMTKLYYQSDNGPVDLYMNDVICMKKSFKEMAQQRQKSQKVNFLKEEEFIDSQGSQEEIDAYPSTTENKKIAINFVILRIKTYIFCEEDLSSWYEQYQPYLIRLKDSILSFIQCLSYSQYLQQLSKKLLSYNKFDRFLCYNFIKRLEKKGNYSKSSKSSSQAIEDHTENSTSLASLRMDQIGQVLTIKSTYLSKKELQPQINNNAFFDAPNIIAKAERSFLFHKFMQFSDLRTVFTTNPKRLKVAKLLITHLKLPEPSNGQITDYLSLCWRYILHLQLQSPSKHYHSNITIAVHNLMIIQDISLQEYCQIFHRIGELSIQPIPKCQLIYTCSTSSVWQANRFYTKYDFPQFRAKFIQALTYELDRLKNLVPAKLSEILTFLIVDGAEFCDLSIFFPYEKELQSIASLLSFEVYQDCCNNLKSSLLRQRYQTDTLISPKQIYEFLSSFSKYSFDYYYFNIDKGCQKSGNYSILINLFNFINKCWEGLDLFPKYKLYHNVIMYIQRVTKTINLTYFEQLLASPIKIQRIIVDYSRIYSISNFIVSKPAITPQLQPIYSKIKQMFTHTFIIQLIQSDQPNQHKLLIYDILCLCFIIYIELYQKESGYFQLISQLIRQLKVKLQTQDEIVRAKTVVTVCMTIGAAIQSINQPQTSIELQIHIASINSLQISKNSIQSLVNKICYIIYHSKIPFTASYYDFIYSALAYIRKPKKILKDELLMLFSQMNFHLLVNRKDPSYFFDMHMNLWKEMQRDYKNQEMVAYFHRSYVFFLGHPEVCSKLAERIKLLPLSCFKELQRYNCACILILLLILEKEYDAVSLRILITITQTLPRVQLYAHSAIKNILYSYCINREVSILSQNGTTFKAPFHDIVPQLMDYRTRKVLYWARKVVKLTNVQHHQQRAYNNVLIRNYDKKSNFCLLFDRFLRRPYQHQRYV